MSFAATLTGPFDLANQNLYFGGYPALPNDSKSIVMTFPVEGWQGSAAVILRQPAPDHIAGDVYGLTQNADKAWTQALAAFSLDIPGEAWPAVGKRDPIIGNLQAKYHFLRPTLFHSPFEAAAGFIIGHRITIKQKQALMQRMAKELGQPIAVNGATFYAFPDPHALLALPQYRGLSEQKLERLHGVAQAAVEGLLDRAYLRSLPIDQALAKLQTLAGVGAFFSQGILYRGAGVVNAITQDDLTFYAVQKAYQLADSPSPAKLQEIAEQWDPYRMWAVVLLHVWLRREVGLPKRKF